MADQQRARVMTAVICIPVFLALALLGGWFTGALALILAVLGCREYYRMIVGGRFDNTLVWLLSGFAYIIVGFVAFLALRQNGGIAWLLWLLLMIWSTDIAAYEVGRRFGKTKLAESISPNKTVEGSLAGIAGALVIGFIFGISFIHVNGFIAFIIPVVISVIGQLGDLAESKVKRLAGVKDSGNLLPGHGGILDRFDSMMPGAVFMYIFLLICG